MFLFGAICCILGALSVARGRAQKDTSKPVRILETPSALPLTGFYNSPNPLPLGKPGELIRTEATTQYSLPYELSAIRILYHSRTVSGADVPVSAVVLIPYGKAPSGGWPVIAWAHEFKGSARRCAPSLIRNLGVGPILGMYANLGYAVVATDYAGLGVNSGTPITDMRSNALDVINSVSAARAAVKEIGSRWIAVGPFEGALAAVAVAEDETKDPNYLGSIATSGLADAQEVFERLALRSSNQMLALALTIKALHPEFPIASVLTDKATPALERMTKTCGGDTDPGFNSAMLKTGWENDPLVKEFFAKNTAAERPARGPLLVISGETDSVVPADMTARTVSRMCKQGDRVLFLKYRDLDSSGVVGASASDQISWIKARFAGYTPPSNCP